MWRICGRRRPVRSWTWAAKSASWRWRRTPCWSSRRRRRRHDATWRSSYSRCRLRYICWFSQTVAGFWHEHEDTFPYTLMHTHNCSSDTHKHTHCSFLFRYHRFSSQCQEKSFPAVNTRHLCAEQYANNSKAVRTCSKLKTAWSENLSQCVVQNNKK